MVKAGEKLGNYELAAAADGSALSLGSGTGGITYLGKHVSLQTQVAVKVLIHRKNLRQKDRDSFLAEARAAASLSHPQIARVLDFGESSQGHPYYVMELCEGGSLEDFHDKSGPPDNHAIVQWLFECSAALAYAHRKGILHRDVKPSNLLIARQDEVALVKLIDFGLADLSGADGDSDQVIGTPHYAAPEQLLGKAVAASDIFSLGASFHWLLTGNHLSHGDVKSVINERLESSGYDHLLEALPPVWKELLGRMLAIDPTARPQDGDQLFADVAAAFPQHSGVPVAWDAETESPASLATSLTATYWQDITAQPWEELWEKAGEGSQEGPAISLTARRKDTGTLYDVLYFPTLSDAETKALEKQADLVARASSGLGLGELILERGSDWWSVAWIALATDDALTWVRQGHNLSIPEIVTALEPIAGALGDLTSGGFGEIDIHPSMLIVSGSGPLRFSLPLTLPAIDKAAQAGDSSGTMRGATGASLAARFASCTYQLLSGRTPPPAAFVNARAYQATPRLSEQANRFLSSAIAGSRSITSCREVIWGLAHEERIPGATLSAGGATKTAASWPSSTMPARSASATPSQPLPVQSSSTKTPPAASHSQPTAAPSGAPTAIQAPPPTSAPAPKHAPVAKPPSAPATKSKLPLLLGVSAAAILLLAAGGYLFLKSEDKPSENPDKTANAPVPDPPDIAGNRPEDPPSKTNASSKLVRVPADAATLTEALAKCEKGGTIEISGGTYSESLVLKSSVSLVATSPAILSQTSSGSSLITAKGPVEITLKNIQIRDTRREAQGEATSSAPLVLASDGVKLRFTGCVIEGSMGNGVSLTNKASTTFESCQIRKNRGYGLNVTSGATATLSLCEIRSNGLAGVSALNVNTKVTLDGGTRITENGTNGLEVANGAQLAATGIELNGNEQVGIIIQDGGSTAKFSSSVISGNRKFGAGAIKQARLSLSDTTVEYNLENGAYVESGATAELKSCKFVENGKIGIYLVNGEESALSIGDTKFTGHSDAGIAVVGGSAEVTDSHFTNNNMAVFFGSGATGRASGNTVFPGPVDNVLVLENAGNVVLENNTVGDSP